YATRVQEFHWPGISEWLWESEFLLVLLSYATVIFQVSFPFLLLNRITKLIAVGCAVLFHGGIALFMGLIGFSWIMIGSELILLTDKDYRLIGAAARRAGAKAAGPLRLLRDRIASLPAVKGRQLIVFYDGWCPLCRARSEEHTSELQSRENLVCRLLLGKKNIRLRVSQRRTSD